MDKITEIKKNYTVRRSEDRWIVCEDEYDGETYPRVTVISIHDTRLGAIDAARAAAGDNMYYVNDAPARGATI